MAKPPETALVVVLEDAEPFDAVRRELTPETVARGVPFHITLLYPFAPRDELSEELLADVRSFFAGRDPLAFALTRIETFHPSVVYAAPEPDASLRACMQALSTRFPAWPPYGGAFEDPTPHATLAEDVDTQHARAEIARRLAPHLPRPHEINTAALLEEAKPDRWRERERFPLGG